MRCGIFVGIAVCLLGGSLALPGGVGAQDNTPAATRMEGMDVEATRDREAEVPAYSATQLPRSAAATVETFDSKEIEEINPATLFDLFGLAPGANVEFMGRKNINMVEIRGGDSLGIIVDGVYLPWSQAGRVLARLNPKLIKSVRIVRDSTAVTLGPLTAFTSPQGSPNQGFIVIETKTPSATEAGVSAGYASNNTQEYHAYAGDVREGLMYRLGLTSQTTDGRDGYNNAEDANSAYLRAGYDNDAIKFDFSLFYADGEREIQKGDAISRTSDSKWRYDPMSNLWLSMTLNKPWSDTQTTSIHYDHSAVWDDLITESYSLPSSTTYDQTDTIDDIHVWHVAEFGGNRLKGGFQAVLWNSPTGQFYYEDIPREENLFGYYLQDEQRLMDDRLTLDLGMRLDTKHILKGLDRYDSTSAQSRKLINDAWAEPAWNGSMGASYKLFKGQDVFGRFGYSSQQADSFLLPVAGKTLGTEERFKYETGLKSGWDPMLNTVVTYFFYDIRNFTDAAGSVGTGVNAINTYDQYDVGRQGVEFEANGGLPLGFSYRGTISYISQDVAEANREQPQCIYTAQLSHAWKRLETNFIVKRVDKYESNFLTLGDRYYDVGDYTRLDANVGYTFDLAGHSLKAMVYGRNLADENYETRPGWEDNGRVVGGELAFSF